MFKLGSYKQIGLTVAIAAALLLLAACASAAPTPAAAVVSQPTAAPTDTALMPPTVEATTAPTDESTTAPTAEATTPATEEATTAAPSSASGTETPAASSTTSTALDWTQLGFPTVLTTQTLTPGTAATVHGGAFTVSIPANAFSTSVKFDLLTGDLANLLDKAPADQQPILAFALRVTDTATNQPVQKFDNPVMVTAIDPSITPSSQYYNIAEDGTFSLNATAPQVQAGQLAHPVSGTGAAWAITNPNPTVTSGKIALLLPESKTTRYESADRPDFTAELTKLCPSCQLIYDNANQDANVQLSQAEAALSNGAQVLVLDPVDSSAAGAIADKAAAQGVPVIAYDRLILNSNGVNYYISFDNVKVGQLQATSLIDHLTALNVSNPTIVMINGSPTDNNATLFKQGAHSVFDPLVTAGKLTIAKEYDTPDWSPDQAQTEMQQALTALGNKVDGVYAANDGTAGGAIAAMTAAKLSPLPPITGQDAELAAIQRILVNQQYMTVYKAIKPEANAAALLAVDLLTKTTIPAGLTNNQTTNNSKMDVPSVLLTPIAVTINNINDTIVKDGFWTAAQICTTQYADACKAAGLSGF